MAAAAVLAGCSSTGASSSASSVKATGSTLDIFISEPPGIASDPAQQDVVEAAELAFDQLESKADNDFKLQLITVHKREISDNARAAIEDQSSVAYLGELAPGDSELTAGITNALDLLTVSPTDTALELTQATAAIPKAPGKYYESLSTYGHTFMRVVPSSAKEAGFDAHAIALVGGPVYVASDGSDYGTALAHAFKRDAPSQRLTVTATESSAKAIFYAAASPAAAARFFNAAATSAPSAKLFGPSALDAPAFTGALSAGARGRTFISVPGFKTSALGTAGAAFRQSFDQRYGHEPSTQAIFGYAAMAAVLHVIAEAGTGANNRETLVKDFLAIRALPSVLGAYSINKSGDTSLSSFVLVSPGGG